ncbi:MAG: hypothetical protein K2P81_17345 [Bacteriovoracaceae bacterium]|nr:hypothetical protein [Bacteriovoracaceae bacterium]
MNQTNGWVFGKRNDLIVFCGPLLASIILLGMHKGNYLGFGEVTLHFAIIQTYINLAHLYSTFWYTYTSKKQWKRHGSWFIGIPLGLFFLNLICGHFFGGTLFIYFIFSHFSIWHFIKQQQAWFHIAASRGVARDKLTLFIDKYAIMACTMGFVLSSQSMEDSRGWFQPGDIVEFPDFLRWPLLGLSILFILAYFTRHLYLIIKKHPTNWAAHNVFICTLLLWGYTRLGERTVLTYYLNQLHHAIPYFLLGYRYMQSQRQAGEIYWLPQLPMWLLGIAIFAISGFQGNIEMNMRANLGLFSSFNDIFDNTSGLVLMSFFNAINITHYTFDMFFWNRKNNPEWTMALGER